MKNKLLLNLLYLHTLSQNTMSLYIDKTDKAGKRIYQNAMAENVAYWWAMCKTYGRKKTAKYIDEYKATQGR